MANRHKKIVLEAEEGITFEVSEAGEELVIRAKKIARSIDKLPTVLAGQYAEWIYVKFLDTFFHEFLIFNFVF